MQKLKRALGLPSLLFYGVGVTVGAGIYSVLGASAGVAGRAVWLSLVLAAVPAFLTGLVYAELASMFPRAGAAYVFVREALPKRRWISFGVGFLVAVTAAATAATVSIAFAGYLQGLVPLPRWLLAALLIAACSGVNIVGIRESTWFTVVCTAIEVIGLFLIIGAGAMTGQFGAGVFEIDLLPVFSAAALSFFVFTGFEGLANLAEETKRPERDLPWAILVSLAFTTVLYVVVAMAAVALLPPDELAASNSPLATAAAKADGRLATAIAWIALFSTANTALITLVVGSRLLYGMAEGGEMPAVLAKTLPGRKTPWTAAVVLAGGACLLLPLGDVAIVGSVSSLATLLIFASVCGALIILRRRATPSEGFRIPFAIAGVPLAPVLAILTIAALLTQFAPVVYLTAAGALGGGAVLYLFVRRTARPRAEPGEESA